MRQNNKKVSFSRFCLITAIVVPAVLLLTSCGGGETVLGKKKKVQTPEEILATLTKCIPFAAHEETTTITIQGTGDVAFVIDDSGSMGDDQTAVGNGFDQAANALLALGIDDVQMGVITTDVVDTNKQGKLQGGPNKYTEGISQASVDSIKARIIGAGSSSSGYERGGEALMRMVDLSAPGGFNAGFIRNAASLTAVIISDENDSDPFNDSLPSSDPMPQEVVDALVAKKGNNPDLVKLHFIGHPAAPTCATGGGSEEAGTRYIEMINYLSTLRVDGDGGQIINICGAASNYATIVPELISDGITNTEITEEVTLVDLDPSGYTSQDSLSIEVKVNGEAIIPGTGTWTYEQDDNAIVIHDPALQMVTASDDAEVCVWPANFAEE